MSRRRNNLLTVALAWAGGCGGGSGTAVLPDGADGSARDAELGPDAPADAGAKDAGGAGAATDIERYCRQYAERSCRAAIQCGPQSARSTESECVTATEQRCLEPARAWQIPAVVSGRVVFDSAAGAACLAASEQGPCGLAWASSEACRRVLVPKVANGGACLDDGECVGGICDRTRTCPGVCAAPGKAGDDCSRYPCDAAVAVCIPQGQTRQCVAKMGGMPCKASANDCAAVEYCRSRDGLACQTSTSQGDCTCAARGGAGSACRLAEECAPGLGCAGGQCRGSVSQQAEPCSYAQGVGCAGGLACVITDGRRSALSGTCGPMRGEGSSCYWIECERGLDCSGGSIDEVAPKQGTCRRKANPGEPCRPFGCTLGYFCDQGVCAARPTAGQSCAAIGGGDKFCFGAGIFCNGYNGGVCLAPPAVGQPCGEVCDGDGYCDAFTTRTCLRRKAAGQPCSLDGECASGTCSLHVCAPACSAASL